MATLLPLFSGPLFPKFRAFTQAGTAPLAAGKVETYVAGTSTPLATYPTYADALALTNANANPVILDAQGEAEIWCLPSLYKIILKDSAGVTQWTRDNVAPGLGYPGATANTFRGEWIPISDVTSAAFAFATVVTFTVTGVDVTSTFHAGRRIRTQNTGGTVYSTVVSSAFAANTTVTVLNDGASVLDAGLSAVYFGSTSYINPSYLDPRTAFSVTKNGNQTGFAAPAKVTTWTVVADALSEWVAGSNHWLCKYPGYYLVQVQAEHSNTAAGIQTVLHIGTTAGTGFSKAETRSWSTATQVLSAGATYLALFTAAQTVSMWFQGDANTTVVGSIGTRLTITRIS